MKAAVMKELNSIVVREVKEPACGDREAILKVAACAVCGSDIRIYHYGNDRVKFPAVIGHEIAGEIVEVGSMVTQLKAGDRVALGADVPCGTCFWCTNGMGTNCSINYAIGYQFPGGFQEYMLLNETTLRYGPVTRIPTGLSFQEAALAEPLACAINGLELARFGLGVILHAKPIALFVAHQHKFPGKIIENMAGSLVLENHVRVPTASLAQIFQQG